MIFREISQESRDPKSWILRNVSQGPNPVTQGSRPTNVHIYGSIPMIHRIINFYEPGDPKSWILRNFSQGPKPGPQGPKVRPRLIF